ncbi:unnamed protein product [Malus baccata var. baccata]
MAVSLEKDAVPSYSFDLAYMCIHSFTKMLFGGNLPTDEEIRDLPGAKLATNPSSCPSLPCVGVGMQEPVMHPTSLLASFDISLKWPNLSGTEQLIHRINLRAAMDIKRRGFQSAHRRTLRCSRKTY